MDCASLLNYVQGTLSEKNEIRQASEHYLTEVN